MISPVLDSGVNMDVCNQSKAYKHTGTVGFSTTGPSGSPDDFFGNTFVADGEWHHIAVVYNGTHKFIYVDGVLDISTVGVGTLPHGGDGLGRITAIDAVRYGYIGDGSESESFNGTSEIDPPARYGKYYTGKIDELRLWHTTRTPNQINDNRFVRLTGCEEDLILYYDFNEGGGTEIYDKARHTYSLFNGGIDWQTGSGPLEDCASPAPDSNPLITGIDGYRYGFNGMEKDDEVKGSGNHVDFGDRGYDPRLGRWLSVDPLHRRAPGWSPFRFGYDNPITFTDPTGMLEDDYKLKQNGEVEKIADTDQPDRLFATNDKGEVKQDNFITIHDDRILPELSKLKYGDSYTGLMQTAQSNDGKLMPELFKFNADNSPRAEWGLVKSSGANSPQYNLGTYFMDDLSPGPKQMGVNFDNVLEMVHSHPVAADGEMRSMGVRPDGNAEGDWNVVINNYYRNGNVNPFPYKVYFPKTQSTFEIDPHSGPQKIELQINT